MGRVKELLLQQLQSKNFDETFAQQRNEALTELEEFERDMDEAYEAARPKYSEMDIRISLWNVLGEDNPLIDEILNQLNTWKNEYLNRNN